MLLLSAIFGFCAAAWGGNRLVRFNEIMAGLNGDSSFQFIELAVADDSQKQWGPQGQEKVGRAMLTFQDAAGRQTGRFVFPSDPPPGAPTVLVATAEFEAVTGLQPDFVMPKNVLPIAGKISFRNNPDAGSAAEPVLVSVSYGGTDYTGDVDGAGPPNAFQLSILHATSLLRFQNFGPASFGPGAFANADFRAGPPTPASTRASHSHSSLAQNAAGELALPAAEPMVHQGETLFKRETFLGNGRTCLTCHLPADQFALLPTRIATLPESDPLFIHEQNVNRIVVNSSGSILGTAPSGATQPSDFAREGVIVGSLGGSATVLDGTGNSYWIIGGASLNIAGNVLTDVYGNHGTLVSFTPGDLAGPTPSNGEERGLEDSRFLRSNRGLIVENINGFAEKAFLRGVPSLLNVKYTAPYGLSGEFADLQSFSSNAVRQHFTRSLQRRESIDFRLPTPEELEALAAFQNSLVFPANENFDEENRFERFLTTDFERQGRDAFFGTAKCSVCHGGKTLSQSDGQFGTQAGRNESFDTGVVRAAGRDGTQLPSEQAAGEPADSRSFNVPSLLAVHRTNPFFHNGLSVDLVEAIQFYQGPPFLVSPAGVQVGALGNFYPFALAAFLRAAGVEKDPAPRIFGTRASQTVYDNASLHPFSEVTVIDATEPPQRLRVIVESEHAVRGEFHWPQGFERLTQSKIVFEGTAAAATAALRELLFKPARQRVPIGASERTSLAISVQDGVSGPVFDNTTSVLSLAVAETPSLSQITDQILLAAEPVLVRFRLFGFDSSSPGLGLSVHSSNPSLIREQDALFSGTGTERMLALTPRTHRSGIARLTVSVRDGARTASTVFRLVVPSKSFSVVAPKQWAQNEAPLSSSDLSSADIRAQSVYLDSEFPPGIVSIRQVRFRRSSSQGPFTSVIPELELEMSTIQATPPIMFGNFSKNIGPDATLVFYGPLSVTSTHELGQSGPSPFGISVPLRKPFVYDSTRGDLLIDIRNRQGASVVFSIDASHVNDQTPWGPFSWSANPVTSSFPSYWVNTIQFEGHSIATPPLISVIEDQTTPAGVPTQDIPFTVWDAEIPAEELVLSAASSNPILLPPANIRLQGHGTNRTVQLTPAPGQSGVARVTIEASDYTMTQQASFILAVGAPKPVTTVVPKAQAAKLGQEISWTLARARRVQQLHASTNFPPGRLAITEMRFRRTPFRTPFTARIPDLQINFSTTHLDPENLRTLHGDLSRNSGPDDTVVFKGALTIESTRPDLSERLTPFDIVVPLQTPFLYDSRAGNLLVDIRNPSVTKVGPIDASAAWLDGASRIYVEPGVWPTADYTADVIEFVFSIVDPPALSAKIIVEGTVTYFGGSAPIPGVTVDLIGGATRRQTTDRQGVFRFEVEAGTDFTLRPADVSDGPADGVTTLDLALARRHILGLELLDRPFKILAADVNDSQSLTTLDLILMRQLILGLTNRVPAGRWKFARSDFNFPNPSEPWLFESVRTYVNRTNDALQQNFIGIKLGDVNGSWAPSIASRSTLIP